MSNLSEYTMKSNYQTYCYSAMKVFLITTYCILCNNIDFNIECIDIIVDLDDELEKINVFATEEETNLIIVNWESRNKINDMYTLYKTQYLGLDNFSILELVSADVIEEDYYYKDERFSIAPSILMKQYCSIVEHEINQIIRLLNFYDKPSDHLMWNDMKKDIVIVCIGTNRTNIVDCLGPFVGSLLKEDKEFNIPVYGSMVKPIHGMNITQSITEIYNMHPNSTIIAIDASLTSEDNNIGRIIVDNKPIFPGAGVNRNHDGIGDFSIIGCVASEGINVVEYETDLKFISAMAYTIAKGVKDSFS